MPKVKDRATLRAEGNERRAAKRKEPGAVALLQHFGTNLRALREARKLSQVALGEKAEMNRTYISQLELGKRDPTLTTISRLASALGEDLQRLTAPPHGSS